MWTLMIFYGSVKPYSSVRESRHRLIMAGIVDATLVLGVVSLAIVWAQKFY